MDTSTTYEIRVRYDNGSTSRWLREDVPAAMQLAESLQALPTARKVWINKVTVEPLYAWEA